MTELAVEVLVCWSIAQDVFMSDFETNPFGDRTQLPQLTSREAASPGGSSDLFKKPRASTLNGVSVSPYLACDRVRRSF
jgi:hypothetical protein